MPKDRRVPSLSLDRSRASPYPCSSKNTGQHRSKNIGQSVGNEKEWEEARCPICMEHPHNAVLLLCSSREKGCRPYMCDTSHRHSNCLDQFRKSAAITPSTDIIEEISLSGAAYHLGREEQRQHGPRRLPGRQLPSKLLCPLCRGQINEWIAIEPARKFMNSKPRSCSLETCDFTGTYDELRKHARIEHPSVRPSQADSRRQRDWARLEREIDFQDFLTASQMGPGEEWSDFIGLEPGEEWSDWIGLEPGDESDWISLERDFENIFGALQSGLEEEWFDTFNMDIETEFPFTFLDMSSPFDSLYETSVSGSSGVRGQSGHSERQDVSRTGGSLSRGSQSNGGQHQRPSSQRRLRRDYW